MLTRKFDPQKPYRVVLYLRMSSDQQNPRSPDQQEDAIRRLIERMKLPWIIVKVYRDDGLSGRYKRKRRAYIEMLTDIRTGRVRVDLILVDTTQRFGRPRDLREIRSKLEIENGVLILNALDGFSDPTSPAGQTHAAFRDLQAHQENCTKAHDVLRGKMDAVKRGFWPGGPIPLGFRLERKFDPRTNRFEGSPLLPNPETSWIPVRAFERAHETGDGQTTLARHLNECPDIPETFKPFSAATVGSWLDSELYYGEMVFPKVHTDVIDDVRRIEPADLEERIRNPDFCPPLVPKEVWMEVQAVRRSRRLARQRDDDSKLIKPLVPGMTLKYLLSGLVRCGLCGASMRPMTSGRQSKSGATYCYYVCPRGLEKGCGNRTLLKEEQLREWVLRIVRDRLFLGD